MTVLELLYEAKGKLYADGDLKTPGNTHYLNVLTKIEEAIALYEYYTTPVFLKYKYIPKKEQK